MRNEEPSSRSRSDCAVKSSSWRFVLVWLSDCCFLCCLPSCSGSSSMDSAQSLWCTFCHSSLDAVIMCPAAGDTEDTLKNDVSVQNAWTEMHLSKSIWTTYKGSDGQKYNFICLLLSRLSEFNLDKILACQKMDLDWQSEYSPSLRSVSITMWISVLPWTQSFIFVWMTYFLLSG